ncbi:F-box/kelch-repeat protein At5g15710-like [Cryptomeria japonica]|uniref:F-box/kelch-repeat protein At5g15710-like n=1 Tax=Cryptomeria japonica TaxID=3369 RepID=UPI0025ACFBF3|nr:F-box/kelch-repeat protein At5g15710-like [Cryptomeria japonica]
MEEMKGESIVAVEGDANHCGISKLPQDLKELIFSKLPLESICSSRIICKEWNFILSSVNFLSSVPIQYPWLLICNDQKDKSWCCMTYCFSAQKWRTLSLSFLPKPKGGNTRFLRRVGLGLLHFQEISTSQLFVCNPLMRSYAEIEIDATGKFMHIVQRGNREPYLVICSNFGEFSFQIYHYFQGSWNIKFQFAGEMRSSHILCYEMVVCNNVLFWRGPRLRVIIGFKIQDEGFISPVTLAPLPSEMVEDRDLLLLSMVSYGSSVLFVFVKLNNQRLDKTYPPSFRGIHPSTVENICELDRTQEGIIIWELFQDEENELVWKWKEFLRMPPLSLHEYLDEDWWYGDCVCVGDYLCFSGLYGGESVKVFAYNLKEGFWQRLPPCKMENRNWRMVSFEPKPYLYQFLRKSRERAWMT